MSCRQNTSDLVERESPDGPGPLQATGAGAPQHKERSVSVRSLQRTPAWGLLTSTTSRYEQHFICLYLTQKSHDNIINLTSSFNMLIIISNYSTMS